MTTPPLLRHEFAVAEATAILTATPAVLRALLVTLPESWVHANEGSDTWSPFDVVGHLLDADSTNWIPRARIILEHGETRAFDDFDRVAHLASSRGRALTDLLDDFATARQESLQQLTALQLTPSDLDRCGRHPALGRVTLRQLLATWVAHDLDHLCQITRVLARQYTDEVGPWRQYLRQLAVGQ
jgi:hypothetical protein